MSNSFMDESVIFVGETINQSEVIDLCNESIHFSRNSASGVEALNQITNFKKPNNLVPSAVIDLSRDSGGCSVPVGADINKIGPLSSSLDLSRDSEASHKQDTKNENKSLGECPICLEKLANLELRVIPCGHVICKYCVSEMLKMYKPTTQCPTCRRKFRQRDVYPVYL